MKRILLLIKGLGRGGAEQLLVSALRHADRERFDYRVAYLLPWKDAFVPELEAAGVGVRCLAGGSGPGWIGRLREMISAERIDLVHAHSPYAAIGARVVRGTRRFVYTEHNVWQRYRPATYWGNLLTYPRNDHVFAVSDHVRMSVRYPAPFGFLRMPPVETLYHGIDPSVPAGNGGIDARRELGVPEGAPLIGTVANLKPHKGHRYLLEAAVRVRRAVPDARFVLVGQGPLRDELEARAKELGLDDAVVFAGFREDALSLAASFDVFVLSSLHEGLSIALVEAMALGKPVVITRVGGLPEVVEDGREGFVVSPGNPRALADAIVSLLRDPGLRSRLGSAARRRAGDFDIRTAVHRMESVYTELLS